jgi:uncharacterized membrane protein
MTATLAPSPWPAPTTIAAQGPAWRFARELHTPSGVVLLWVLRRNCALSPRQLLAAVVGISAVSLAISLAFWWHGAKLVLPFAGLEVLGLAGAMLAYARHAGDRETLTLSKGLLKVEHQHGNRTDSASFHAAWVRVEPQHGDASLVELSAKGHTARVGRYVAPHARPLLAQELRRALRASAAAAPKDPDLELK